MPQVMSAAPTLPVDHPGERTEAAHAAEPVARLGRRREQGEAAHQVGSLDGDLLRDGAGERVAEQVGGAAVLKQRDHVIPEQRVVVLLAAPRTGRRRLVLPGQVVALHVVAGGSEHGRDEHEVLLRTRDAGREQHPRIPAGRRAR